MISNALIWISRDRFPPLLLSSSLGIFQLLRLKSEFSIHVHSKSNDFVVGRYHVVQLASASVEGLLHARRGLRHAFVDVVDRAFDERTCVRVR